MKAYSTSETAEDAPAALNAFRRAVGWLARGLEIIANVIGISVGVIVLAEVVLRFAEFQVPPAFEELANFLFVWWVFIGASIAVRRLAHPRITAVVDRLPAVLGRQVLVVAELLSLAYFVLLAGFGFDIAALATQPSLALDLPMTYPYLALGVGGALMALFQIESMIGSVTLDRWSAATMLAVVGAAAAAYGLSTINIYLFIVVVTIILFLMSVPVAVVLGLVTLVTLASADITSIVSYPIRLFDGLSNFILLSIPLFMLTGALMSQGGISRRLVDFAGALVGWVRGGLGLADIVASVFFADISGSAVSDTAAIGSIMIPGMVQRGYDRPFATALQAAAGSLGMLFPPSITMILYAWVANVSVARLFLSSFLPGLLVASTFAVVTYVIARRRNFPRETQFAASLVFKKLREASAALLTPAVILGGILGGIFTPTEAGVVAAAYALAIGLFYYRDLSFRDLPRIICDATVSMSRVIFIAGNAIAFSWVLIIHQGPQQVADLLLRISDTPIVILALINIVLVLLHVVLEGASTVVAIVPVFLPLLATLHVDPVYFGIIVMLNSAAGLLMPPIGLCLYISCAMAGERIETVARAIIPFVIAIFADIAILLFFPKITSIVPDIFMR